MAIGMSDNLRGAGFMVVAMAAFTLGDACMRTLAAHLPLYQAVTLRSLLTLPLLVLIGHWTGGLDLRGSLRSWRLIGLRTLAEILATLSFFFALINLPFATLSSIMQALPLAVTAGAALVFKEPIGWRRTAAILAGFCGVLLIVRPGPSGVNIFALLALASVAFVVVRDLSTRRLPVAVPSVTVALVAAAGVTVTCAVLSLADPWQPVPMAAVPLIAGAACFGITGYIFIIRVMRVGEVGFTTPFRYTALVWAVVLGWVVFGEWPDVPTFAGAGIIVASGLFTVIREARLRRSGHL